MYIFACVLMCVTLDTATDVYICALLKGVYFRSLNELGHQLDYNVVHLLHAFGTGKPTVLVNTSM